MASDVLFDSVFRNSSIGMAVLRADGTFVTLNPAFLELTRYDSMDSMPNCFWDLLAEEDRDVSRERVRTLGDPGERYSWLVRVRDARRVALWQLDVSVAAVDAEGPLLLVNARDVTLQKNTELRLKRAKELAEQATRTKSAFLANMSHEIRTPIHTITGMTELLLETTLDEEQREYAGQVQFAAEVLLYLINDILDFSKIEAGKLSLESIDFDPLALTEQAVDMVSLQAHRKGIETIVRIGPGLPRLVNGDPGRLRQIIVNLFNNAVKFTPEGGDIETSVELVGREDGRARLRFQVDDTGIGIPESKLDRLFSAFSQVDSSTTRKYGGTGLGLSISHSLVRMMDGRIGVESEEGRGSSFWFEVPLPTRAAAREDDPVCAGKRILLIDDNERSQRAIVDYLRRWGAEPSIVGTGQEALERLIEAVEAGSPYDLALVDLELPGMDGWQLASEINANHTINATPLILLTPTGLMAGEAKMKRLMWFNGYASKPVRYDALQAEISKALEAEMELPAADDDAAELEAVEEVTPISARLVVAEDHLVNQRLFRAILEKLGHTVVLAATGREAVDAVKRSNPDLVFMDVQMPEMNGYEASAAIRRFGYNGPIVAVTANAVKGEREKCLEAGMNDFLTKPFKREDLVPLLDRWIGSTFGAETSPGEADPAEVADAVGEDPGSQSTEYVGDPGYELPRAALGGAAAAGGPVFDYAAAIDRFAGNAAVVRSVVERLVERLPDMLVALRRHLDESDFEALEREAHGLKGGARNLDAAPLGNAAALLEASARLRDVRRARHYLDALDGSVAEFIAVTSHRIQHAETGGVERGSSG